MLLITSKPLKIPLSRSSKRIVTAHIIILPFHRCRCSPFVEFHKHNNDVIASMYCVLFMIVLRVHLVYEAVSGLSSPKYDEQNILFVYYVNHC